MASFPDFLECELWSRSDESNGWIFEAKQPSEEECTRLRSAVARLQAKGSTLRALVEVEEVDREALDEEVHGLDFLVDSARRLCWSLRERGD